MNSGTFNLSGSGQITGNHADGMGGGIFCQSSVVSMSGGTITDNTAEVGTGTDCAGLSGENGSFTFSGGNLGGEINQLANPVVSVTGGRMDRDAYTSLKGNLESGKAAAYLTASDGGTNYDAEYPYGMVDENKIVATANHNGVEVNFISLASAADYAALYGNEVSFTAGDFTISGGVLGTDFSYADGVLTILTNKELTISNTDSSTSTTDRIVVNSGATATLILNNVDITGNSTTSGPQSAIDLSAGATLTLILEDGTSNTLVGAAGGAYDGAPGIHVPEGATLIIQGSGSLTVTGGSSQTGYTGNGIGGWHDSTGGSNNEACGTVIILAGGNININAGSGGSGDGKDIGGGFGNSGLSASDGSGIRPSSNDNNTYTVYGDLTLPTDVTTYTIPQGVTVNVPGGTSLTIPEGVELVVNGTLNVAGALTNNGTLSGDGTLKGSGTFTDNGTNSIKNNAFTTNISVSTSGNAVVGGTVTLTATVTNGLNENITSGSVTSYRGGASSGNEINTNAASVSNGSATYTINSLDWTPSETAYTITAVYTPATGSSQQSASGTTSLTVGQGQPSITAVAYKGENQTNEFTYGDTITIEGTASVSSPVSANSLTANQVGLYLGENQLGNAVTVGSGGSFTLTYDTGDKGIPIGDYQTLTIKYGGSGNLTTGEATVTITLNKKQVSALVQGDITKTWDGDDDAAVSLSVSADDLVAGDSLTVTAPNTAYASTGVSDSIVIDFGTLTVAGAAADFYTVNAPTGVTGSITPAGASVGTAPAAVENLVYADSAQDLVSGGAASGGNLVYALGAETEATETYSQTVPQESNAGTYYVWYYVQGDSNHNDSDPACVTVSIAKKDISGANITLGTALIYNGDQQTQTITSVTVDGLTLTAGDYTIRSNTGTNVESYYNASQEVRLSAYADTIVYEPDGPHRNILRAIRFGGYPEMVRGLADAVYAGGTLDANVGDHPLCLESQAKRYRRQVTHDGVYAEATLLAIDDDQQATAAGNDKDGNDEQEKMDLPPRKCIIFCPENDRDRLFEEVDRKTAVPLIPEFRDYVLEELERRGILKRLQVVTLKEKLDAWVLLCRQDDANIIAVVEDGLKSGAISIPGTVTAPDGFDGVENVTGYLNTFGVTVAERIRKQFQPLFDPAGDPLSPEILAVNDYIRSHAGYSLYDAQLAVAEAVKRQLQKHKCGFIVAECGSGKSKIGATAMAGVYALRAEQAGRGRQKTFNVILCPSHVANKWAREISETLPDTAGVVVRGNLELDRLYALYEKGDKSIYAIISKERARDGFMKRPAVIWNRR